jgi:hypothetical protein
MAHRHSRTTVGVRGHRGHYVSRAPIATKHASMLASKRGVRPSSLISMRSAKPLGKATSKKRHWWLLWLA